MQHVIDSLKADLKIRRKIKKDYDKWAASGDDLLVEAGIKGSKYIAELIAELTLAIKILRSERLKAYLLAHMNNKNKPIYHTIL